jgi:hypothetical protein
MRDARRRRDAAEEAVGNPRMTLGVPIYIAWAFAMDAAVHGWDDMKLVP